jgi:curved DNA-binding protein CbpA
MKRTVNYFKDCKTLDEARKTYHKLAMQLHPDKGGDEEEFKELANQFHSFHPDSKKYENEINDWSSKAYAHVISQLIIIPEIVIEICGSWIWISGNTKAYKEKIKSIETDEFYKRGFSAQKQMWYFSPKGYRKKSKDDFDMQTIRDIYGSETIREVNGGHFKLKTAN